MSVAAGIVLVVAVEVAQCRRQRRKKGHLNHAHERGQGAHGKRGKNGGEGGAKGGGWVGGGFESSSRARVANVWRDARLQREKKLLRKGEELPKYPGYEPVPAENIPRTSDPDHRPVDVYHGLRDPTNPRAVADDDPMHDRKVAPPGGDIELSRPFASRPKLLRPSAADAFRRDPLPGPSTRGIRAREEVRDAERKARGERRLETSRRYFGTETFRRPETLTRRGDPAAINSGSDAMGGGSNGGGSEASRE